MASGEDGRTPGRGSEEAVFKALKAQAEPGEVVLRGVRLTDPRHGDLEADLIFLMPDVGAAVIEVKGGAVTYEEGQWRTASRGRIRRTNPVEQARRAKHALRRYLDRQPEWNHGLLRSQWFVALPSTAVKGDLGPEGLRQQIIDAGDLSTIRDRVRAILDDSPEPVPPGDWVDEVVSLLHRSGWHGVVARPPSFAPPVAIGALAAASSIGGVLLWGWWGLLAGLLAPTAALAWRAATGSWRPRALALAVAIGLGLGAGAGVVAGSEVASACDPNYQPCVPIQDDADCGGLQFAVTVVGKDVYDLDRDGDGRACESYASPSPQAP